MEVQTVKSREERIHRAHLHLVTPTAPQKPYDPVAELALLPRDTDGTMLALAKSRGEAAVATVYLRQVARTFAKAQGKTGWRERRLLQPLLREAVSRTRALFPRFTPYRDQTPAIPTIRVEEWDLFPEDGTRPQVVLSVRSRDHRGQPLQAAQIINLI